MNTKEAMIEFIRSLPEDLTPEQIVDRIALKIRIDEGIRQSENGEVIDHEVFEKQMAKWLR